MNSRAIREEAYTRCRKQENMTMVILCLVVTVVAGMLVLFLFSASGNRLMGLIFTIVAIAILSNLVRNFRKKSNLILNGYLTEAEVMEIRTKDDSENGKVTVAVYGFTLPGGKERKVEERISSSKAGILGMIKPGVKVPLFVDLDDTANFHIETYYLEKEFTESLRK